MTKFICWDDSSAESSARSFMGGRPKLPKAFDLPSCRLCSQPLTFFMQVACPSGHGWEGYSIALFACMDCVDEDFHIPEMLNGKLAGAKVSAKFLSRYQNNFRILVFETKSGVLRSDYKERVAFRALKYQGKRGDDYLGRFGGKPKWVLDDEAPATVAGARSVFLLQVRQDIEFAIVRGARRQMETDYLAGRPKTVRSSRKTYRLFVGNEWYMFGTERPSGMVYVVTQVD